MNVFDEAIYVLYEQGFSIIEIAYLLGIPIGEVKFSIININLYNNGTY